MPIANGYSKGFALKRDVIFGLALFVSCFLINTEMLYLMRRPLQLLVLAVEHVVLEKESLRPGFTTARGHASGDHVHQRRGHVQHPRTMTIVHRGLRHRCNSARSRCEIASSQMHARDVMYRRSCQTTKCHLCCLDMPVHLLFSVHICFSVDI